MGETMVQLSQAGVERQSHDRPIPGMAIGPGDSWRLVVTSLG